MTLVTPATIAAEAQIARGCRRRKSTRRAKCDGTAIALHLGVTEEDVRRVLSSVIDPELGLDVVALGLVYKVDCSEDSVDVDLTMTTPSCPLGEHIRDEAERLLAEAYPNARVTVNLVWSPPWEPERMSDEAKAALGW